MAIPWRDEEPATWSADVLRTTRGWQLKGENETRRLELNGNCPVCDHPGIHSVIPAEVVRGLQEATKGRKGGVLEQKVETVFCECLYAKDHHAPESEKKGCGRRGEVDVVVPAS